MDIFSPNKVIFLSDILGVFLFLTWLLWMHFMKNICLDFFSSNFTTELGMFTCCKEYKKCVCLLKQFHEVQFIHDKVYSFKVYNSVVYSKIYRSNFRTWKKCMFWSTYIHFCNNIQKLYVSLFLTLNLILNNTVFLDNCVEITCHFNTC